MLLLPSAVTDTGTSAVSQTHAAFFLLFSRTDAGALSATDPTAAHLLLIMLMLIFPPKLLLLLLVLLMLMLLVSIIAAVSCSCCLMGFLSCTSTLQSLTLTAAAQLLYQGTLTRKGLSLLQLQSGCQHGRGKMPALCSFLLFYSLAVEQKQGRRGDKEH
jgi:hypothetical protein